MASTSNNFAALFGGGEPSVGHKKSKKSKGGQGSNAAGHQGANGGEANASQSAPQRPSAAAAIEQLEETARQAVSGKPRWSLWKQWIQQADDTKMGGGIRYDGGQGKPPLNFGAVLLRSRALDITLQSCLTNPVSNPQHEAALQAVLGAYLPSASAAHGPELVRHVALLGEHLQGTFHADVQAAASKSVSQLLRALMRSSGLRESGRKAPKSKPVGAEWDEKSARMHKLSLATSEANLKERNKLSQDLLALARVRLQGPAGAGQDAGPETQECEASITELVSCIQSHLAPGKGSGNRSGSGGADAKQRELAAIDQEMGSLQAQMRSVEAQLHTLRTQVASLEAARSKLLEKPQNARGGKSQKGDVGAERASGEAQLASATALAALLQRSITPSSDATPASAEGGDAPLDFLEALDSMVAVRQSLVSETTAKAEVALQQLKRNEANRSALEAMPDSSRKTQLLKDSGEARDNVERLFASYEADAARAVQEATAGLGSLTACEHALRSVPDFAARKAAAQQGVREVAVAGDALTALIAQRLVVPASAAPPTKAKRFCIQDIVAGTDPRSLEEQAAKAAAQAEPASQIENVPGNLTPEPAAQPPKEATPNRAPLVSPAPKSNPWGVPK